MCARWRLQLCDECAQSSASSWGSWPVTSARAIHCRPPVLYIGATPFSPHSLFISHSSSSAAAAAAASCFRSSVEGEKFIKLIRAAPDRQMRALRSLARSLANSLLKQSHSSAHFRRPLPATRLVHWPQSRPGERASGRMDGRAGERASEGANRPPAAGRRHLNLNERSLRVGPN